MKLFVFGTEGRMAKAIKELALKAPHTHLLDVPEKACPMIDFTAPAALEANLTLALGMRAPYMVGTTGLSENQFQGLRDASQKIPVLWAPNTSLGANLLFELATLSSKVLTGFKASIQDIHHAHKKDSPSGTALSLQKAIDRTCEIASTRTGEVAGIHEVLFESPFESLSLKHEVSDRRVFAQGALLAAAFLSHQKPGLYTMKDVLGSPK